MSGGGSPQRQEGHVWKKQPSQAGGTCLEGASPKGRRVMLGGGGQVHFGWRQPSLVEGASLEEAALKGWRGQLSKAGRVSLEGAASKAGRASLEVVALQNRSDQSEGGSPKRQEGPV